MGSPLHLSSTSLVFPWSYSSLFLSPSLYSISALLFPPDMPTLLKEWEAGVSQSDGIEGYEGRQENEETARLIRLRGQRKRHLTGRTNRI